MEIPFGDWAGAFPRNLTALAEIFGKIYISIAAVDLNLGQAVVLKSSGDPEMENMVLPWEDLLKRYLSRRAFENDRALIWGGFCLRSLENLVEIGKVEKSLEVRCLSGGIAEWVEISTTVISSETRQLLVTTRNINKERMLKNFVDRFVYRNCDYFVLLDAKRNSYVMYGSGAATGPLPPLSSDDYTAEMIRYNASYTSPGQVEELTAKMQIPYLLDRLEERDEYTIFYEDASDPERPRHKQIHLEYYDRANALILLVRTDVTEIFLEEKQKREQLAEALRAAQTDSLTGLYNRGAFSERVTRSLKEHPDGSAAFLFIDMDDFKHINDTLGHQAGDLVLLFAARTLKKIAGSSGIIGRVGGDEFLLFLPDFSSREELDGLARQVCCMFEGVSEAMTTGLTPSCSVGIALAPDDGSDYSTLVHKADQALYSSKREGKRRFSFYQEAPEASAAPSMFSLIDGDGGSRPSAPAENADSEKE